MTAKEKTLIVTTLAELPAERLVDLQLICSLASANDVLGVERAIVWSNLLTLAIEKRKSNLLDFDEVDSNPIGI